MVTVFQGTKYIPGCILECTMTGVVLRIMNVSGMFKRNNARSLLRSGSADDAFSVRLADCTKT